MFKLTVVNGAFRGQAFQVKDGEMSIGRIEGNDIVLTSQKVSKKHCVLVVDNSGVTVKDAGSSNGTFVNGVLTKIKKMMPGDRLSVGEFVLELTKVDPPKPRPAPVASMPSNVLPLHPGGAPLGMPGLGIPGAAPGGPAAGGSPSAAAPPQNLKEKVQFYFEKYVINFVYNLNEKNEWRAMMAGMFVILTAAGSVLSVYPVLDRVGEKLAIEARERASLLARQMVDRNAPYLYERMDTKVDVAYIEKEPGVLSAYLIDMEGRVLAPGRKLNQYLTEPAEASFSAELRSAFNKNETLVRYWKVYGDAVAVAVPLRIFSQQAGKNVIAAVGTVFFDRTHIMFDVGTESMAYIQAFILSAIMAVIIFFSLYRLTLRPLVALNDDIDQVLKGNATSVNKKFKMEEIDPLIDVVNAALQRVGGGGGGAMGLEGGGTEDVVSMLKFAANRMSGAGMLIFSGDKKILHVSPFMEEITGIRNDAAVGSGIGDVARDAAFVAFVDDALAKAPSVGQEPLAEDFEFSGTAYRVECLAYGQPGAIKAYALVATKPAS